MSGLLLGDVFDPNRQTEGDYLDGVYGVFLSQMVASPPEWKDSGTYVSCRRQPTVEGRHDSFWHVASASNTQSGQRTFDVERCRRIHWIRPMIEMFNAAYPDRDPSIEWWESDHRRSRHKRYTIALPSFDYVVSVEERVSYALLVTAFPVERPRRRAKFMQECSDFHARARAACE